MRFRTETPAERQTRIENHRLAWKKRFAFIPTKITESLTVWLEWYETRDVFIPHLTCGGAGTIHYVTHNYVGICTCAIYPQHDKYGDKFGDWHTETRAIVKADKRMTIRGT